MSRYWSKLLCSKGEGHFERKIKAERGSPTNDRWRQKTVGVVGLVLLHQNSTHISGML